MKRLLFIVSVLTVFAAGATVIEKNGAVLKTYTMPAGWVSNMSDNGHWAVWQPYSYGETDARVIILDIQNGKLAELPLTDPEQKEEGVARMCDITDDGKTVVGFFSRQPAYYRDGVWTRLPLPTGMRRWEGEITSVSANGKIMAGWVNNNWESWFSVVYKMNDSGEYELIDQSKFPTYETLFENGMITESAYNQAIHDYGENAVPNMGCHGVSGDGKWIVMSVNRNQRGVSGYFLFNTETETPKFLGRRLSGEFTMSNNGRYLLLGGQLYDTETDKLTNVVTASEGGVSVVDNNGNVFYEVGALPVGGLRGGLCRRIDGVDVDLADVLKQKYDIDFYSETGLEATGYAVTVSDDCKTLIAMPSMVVDSYTLTLPEPIADTYNGINVLQEWQASPAAGLKLAHLSTVAVKLNRDAKIKEGAKAYIQSGGTSIAETDRIAYGNTASNSLFRIDFDVQNFEEGKEYTVVIPAGTFYLPGTSSKTPEITITYTGRADGPVEPASIIPAEGSDVTQCDASNAFGVRFAVDIMLGNPAERPAVYEKGSTSPLSYLETVIQDRMLILYSALGVVFPKGLDYEVRIPANTVTDPAGFCGNEAMVVDYKGAYEIPPRSGYFSEDFSQPNVARNNFLYYEGDHLQPSAAMVEWGFDIDNNPWNFSIRDDSNYDYCAASHSMYEPAGQSNDWMIIPQFRIQGKSAFLTFKGQSYKKLANDRLKVYVWESDRIYSGISSDVIESILKDGTLVFDERLSPGSEENILAGDWTDYRVELGEFDGKNIYIAFLNDNNNQSAIFIDDIVVDSEGTFSCGARIATHVINQDEIEVGGELVSKKDKENLKHVKAVLTNTANGFTTTYESDIDLGKGDRHEFVFPEKMKLDKGVANRYEVMFDVDGEVLGATGSVKNLTKEMTKKVMIEETTGAWCGNCPLGTIAFEEIEKRHPGQLVAIAIHDGDNYAFDGYSQYLSTGGDPNGRVNRSQRIVHPLPSMSLVSQTGDQSWYDLFLRELSSPAECEIKVKRAMYAPEKEQMQAQFDIEFGLNTDNVYYNVLTVVLEDDLPITQTNYFANPAYDGYEILGEWRSTGSLGSQGEQARTYANHVARGIAGLSFNGESGHIPHEVEAGKVYSSMTTFGAPILREAAPANGERMKNVSVACIILDSATGNAVNSDIYHGVEIGVVGIDEVSEEAVRDVVLKVVDGKVYANGSEENVEVYTIQGQRVANDGLKGIYIVRGYGANGDFRVEKMIIR